MARKSHLQLGNKCNPHKNVTLNLARSLDAYISSTSNPHNTVSSQKKLCIIWELIWLWTTHVTLKHAHQ